MDPADLKDQLAAADGAFAAVENELNITLTRRMNWSERASEIRRRIIDLRTEKYVWQGAVHNVCPEKEAEICERVRRAMESGRAAVEKVRKEQ